MKLIQLVFLALELAASLARWFEREKLRTELEREAFRQKVKKHNEAIFEAADIRARTRAELDALNADELRQHPDANFRD